MERRLILIDVKKKGSLLAGAMSGLGLPAAEALSDQSLHVARFVHHSESGQGLTDGLRGMAEQVRLLSATLDALLCRAQ
jgi:hypothetical protein